MMTIAFRQLKPTNNWWGKSLPKISRDDIEGRDQCEQLLKTVSDANGRFRITGVKRDAPWLELFYFGDGIFAQRDSNLRDRDDRELERLELIAALPAQLTVRIDRERHAGAERLSLQAEGHINGQNAITRMHSHICLPATARASVPA